MKFSTFRISGRSLKASASAKNEDIKELLSSQNASTAIFAANYLAFVAVLFFITSILITTTDVDIFLDQKLPLPIISGQVNLRAFFFICPWVILLLYANLLSKLDTIAARGKLIDEQIAKIKDKESQERYRHFIVSHLNIVLSRGPELNRIVFGICYISFLGAIFVAPLAILLTFQWRFLGYHSVGITFSQSMAILLDCIICWSFWSANVEPHSQARGLSVASTVRVLLGRIVPVGVASFALLIALPSSSLEPWTEAPWSWIPDQFVFVDKEAKRWDGLNPVGKLLFETRRLDLSGATIIQADTKTDAMSSPEACNFAGTARLFRPIEIVNRDLRGANFTGARLIGVTFRQSTNLTGAIFQKALLVSVSFEAALVEGARFQGACLHDIDGSSANFSLSNWVDAKLKDSRFDDASFRFSNMTRLTAERVAFGSTDFSGASLKLAQLTDIVAKRMVLTGADLSHSKIKRSDLAQAPMEFANFSQADFDTVQLNRSQSSWSDFSGATLSGVTLEDAELARSNFERAAIRNIKFARARTIAGPISREQSDNCEALAERSSDHCVFLEAKRWQEFRSDEVERFLCKDPVTVCPLLRRALGATRSGSFTRSELAEAITTRIRSSNRCDAFEVVVKSALKFCLGQNPSDLVVQLHPLSRVK